ncbi:GH-E family nuclease [Nocardia sp. CA-135953]|uniref:GH-E family nuclease n=1 Tax=Nocardia sp. CA-135953 TaxID=3239978 RepID=UPI003D985396
MLAKEVLVISQRLAKDIEKAGVAAQRPARGVAAELRTGTMRYVERDQLKNPEKFSWRERTNTPNRFDTAGRNATDSSSTASQLDVKPDHIKGKLNDWVYGRSRPGYPAKSKNDVIKNANQRADGKLLCTTSNKPLEVQRKANGEPQFFKYNNKGHAKKTDAPEWYDPTGTNIVQNNVEFTKPAKNVADMGHIEGAEYWRLQQFAIRHPIDEQGFKEASTSASHNRLEDRGVNRGHSKESTEPGYGIYAELAEKYPPLPGAPDPGTIVKGLEKPGSG